jgi:putative transposase
MAMGMREHQTRVPSRRQSKHCHVLAVTEGTITPRYRNHMAHTYTCNLVHCVFSTKDRASLIPDPERLWQYIGGIARQKSIPLLAAGGTANHLHLLISLPPTITLAKAVQELKGNTSRWLNETARFAWQEGYGAFSVSELQRKTVVEYIDRQAEHHAKWSFEQEFLALLKKSGLPYDPRFVLG